MRLLLASYNPPRPIGVVPCTIKKSEPDRSWCLAGRRRDQGGPSSNEETSEFAELTRSTGSLIRNQIDSRGAARSTGRQDSLSRENCQGGSHLFVEVALVKPRATTIKLQLEKSIPRRTGTSTAKSKSTT